MPLTEAVDHLTCLVTHPTDVCLTERTVSSTELGLKLCLEHRAKDHTLNEEHIREPHVLSARCTHYLAIQIEGIVILFTGIRLLYARKIASMGEQGASMSIRPKKAENEYDRAKSLTLESHLRAHTASHSIRHPLRH